MAEATTPAPAENAAPTINKPAEGTASQQVPPKSAQPVPQGQGQGESPLSGMLPMLIGMVLIFYFLMIRPENKRRKQQQEMLSAMKKNDKVILASSGIMGVVKDIDTDEVTVLIDPKNNTSVKVRKEFITVVEDKKEEKK